MQRYGDEMNAGADASSPQLGNECLAVNLQTLEIQPDDVQMPGMPEPRVVWRKLNLLKPGECLVVDLRITPR